MNKKTLIIGLIIIICFAIGGGAWQWEGLRKAGEIKKNEEQGNIKVKYERKHEQNQENRETEIDTSNWNLYKDEEYGFEVKYPSEWNISEKKFSKGESQSLPVPFKYIAKKYETGQSDRLDYYSVIINAPFGYVSFIPFTIIIADKPMENIKCDHDSLTPCFDKKDLNIEKVIIDNKEVYMKKYNNENSRSLFFKDLPKKWSPFNEIYFTNQNFGNLSLEDNVYIDRVFDEIIKSIHFFE